MSMLPLWAQWLAMVLPIGLGSVVTSAWDWLTRRFPRLQNLPDWAHRVIVTSAAFGLTMVVAAGFPLTTTDPSGLTPADYGSVLAAIMAFIFKTHNNQQKILAAKE